MDNIFDSVLDIVLSVRFPLFTERKHKFYVINLFTIIVPRKKGNKSSMSALSLLNGKSDN